MRNNYEQTRAGNAPKPCISSAERRGGSIEVCSPFRFFGAQEFHEGRESHRCARQPRLSALPSLWAPKYVTSSRCWKSSEFVCVRNRSHFRSDPVRVQSTRVGNPLNAKAGVTWSVCGDSVRKIHTGLGKGEGGRLGHIRARACAFFTKHPNSNVLSCEFYSSTKYGFNVSTFSLKETGKVRC